MESRAERLVGLRMGDLNRTVLLVEDDDDTRGLLAEVLGEAGYAIVQAHDGHEALVEALDARPAVVVLDLIMPGASGWEFLQWRQKHPGLRAVPVMVLSGLPPRDQNLGHFSGVESMTGWGHGGLLHCHHEVHPARHGGLRPIDGQARPWLVRPNTGGVCREEPVCSSCIRPRHRHKACAEGAEEETERMGTGG